MSTTTTVPVERDGDLSRSSPEVILAFCEATRFTGSLHFESPGISGLLPMLAGVPEIPEGERRLARAFEVFVATTEGRYELRELLPDLDGATRVTDTSFTGTLGPLTVADLLRYSGAVGLTGQITLSRPDRGVLIRCARGEIASITVNDASDVDLVTLFAWTEGRFALGGRSVFAHETRPAPAPPSMTEIEVALADVLSRTVPALAGAPSSAGTPAPSLRRFTTQPFGLAPEAPSSEGAKPTVNPEDERWEPSEATSGRLRTFATLPPPPRPDSTVKIRRVERDPTGAYAAVRLSDDEVLPPPAAPPRSSDAASPVAPTPSHTQRVTRLALQQARTLVYVLGAALVVVGLLAAYLLGRMTR